MRISDWSSDVCSSDLLQQAIKLLQLSNLELADYVEQELERNPLLEREDDGAGEPADLPESQPEVPTDRTGVDRLTSAESFAEGPEGPLDTEIGRAWCRERVCQYA